MILSKKKRYLQIALNSSLNEAYQIIQSLPISDTIRLQQANLTPYLVADLKTMDRGETEVRMATEAGASAAICLGQAPVETINSFIMSCEKNKIDSMLDMM